MALIEEPSNQSKISSKNAFLQLAFRPFFIGAASFAVISMLVWLWLYFFGGQLADSTISIFTWHAHEMIFGYSGAVIAGFVLTAVQNWTGVPTIKGMSLLALFTLWVLARIIPISPFANIELSSVFDLAFNFLLLVFTAIPVLKVNQIKQFGILAVLFLLFLSNVVFYLGVFQYLDNGINLGLYSGLYLILMLIFIMARRVVPFFIEKGVEQSISIINYKSIDLGVLIFFLIYAVLDIFSLYHDALMIISAVLLLLHSVRIIAWYNHGIWKKPLLWSIYLAYGFIVFGFALKLMINYYGVQVFLDIHAFTVGGIGLLTISMMSRVALGHTGRNVFEPPKSIFWILLALTVAVFCRVILPLFIPSMYALWILLSQVFWIVAFSLFLYVYFPILIQARIDGRPG